MELLKLLNTNEIVAQIIAFLVLLYLMKRFAWKPILKTLDDRRSRIASEFKNIEDAKAEAESLRSDYAGKLAEIEEEAREKIRIAIEDGKLQAEKIREEAREEGSRILAKAQDNIKSETAKAEEALKEKIVEITIDIAGKVVQERLTVEDDKKIVETFLKEIENR